MKRILSSALALALALLFGGVAHAQDKKPAFGALDSMNAETAKAKLAAWLKDVGKSDAQTLQKLDAIWKDNQRTVLDR